MVPDSQLHNRGNSSSKGKDGVRKITKAVATRGVATRVGITIIIIIIKGVHMGEIMATMVRTGINRMIRGIIDHPRVKIGANSSKQHTIVTSRLLLSCVALGNNLERRSTSLIYYRKNPYG